MDPLRPLPVVVAPTAERKTEPGRFESALRGAAEGAAGTLVRSASLAASFVPGGPVLAGAIRGATSPRPSALGPTTGGGTPALPGSGSASVAAPAPGFGASGVAGVAGAVGGDGDLLGATRALQAEAQTFNLQYLQLQESMQRESREFTAVSNVMKVRHETAKNAIQNVGH